MNHKPFRAAGALGYSLSNWTHSPKCAGCIESNLRWKLREGFPRMSIENKTFKECTKTAWLLGCLAALSLRQSPPSRLLEITPAHVPSSVVEPSPSVILVLACSERTDRLAWRSAWEKRAKCGPGLAYHPDNRPGTIPAAGDPRDPANSPKLEHISDQAKTSPSNEWNRLTSKAFMSIAPPKSPAPPASSPVPMPPIPPPCRLCCCCCCWYGGCCWYPP